MKLVYICHPYANDPKCNKKKVLEICKHVLETSPDCIPIAPQIYFPQFMSEQDDRKRAMSFCLELVERCDEFWIYGNPTEGMKQEIELRSTNGGYLRFIE